MANFKAAFPSKYLRPDDIGSKRPVVTVENVSTQQVASELKLVAEYTDSTLKPHVLNKVNAEMIAEIAGTDDTDGWPGTEVQLYVTRVEFQGKRIPAIRIARPPSQRGRDDEAPF